jgi:uncharacterized protein (TIGR00269 family)
MKMLCGCGERAVYYREHEGNAYCASCFSNQIENTFNKTVRESKLIKKSDVVVVGVSGGKDSSVLLYLLAQLQKRVGFSLKAVSVDEGISGYRDASLLIAKNICASLYVEHSVFSFKQEFGKTMDDLNVKKYCTYCGVLRRNLINKAARELGATVLAVGHNLDDEAQSILMNIINSDVNSFMRLGPKPSSSNNSKFVPRIKPIRNILEKEIIEYAKIKKIPFYDGECPYSKDNVRREALFLLDSLEKKRPGTKMKIVSFYDSLNSYEKKQKIMNYCMKCGEPSSKKICMACTLIEKLSKNEKN